MMSEELEVCPELVDELCPVATSFVLGRESLANLLSQSVFPVLVTLVFGVPRVGLLRNAIMQIRFQHTHN